MLRLTPRVPEGLRSGLQHLYNRHLTPHDEGRRLLVVGSGPRGLPGQLLQTLHAHGFPVTLVAARVARWERALVDRVVQVDLSRPELVLERVRAEHAQRPVRGCLTAERTHVPLAAQLGHALGLRGTPPEVAARLASPEALQAALTAAGLLAPARTPPSGEEEHTVLSVVATDAVSHLALVDSLRPHGAAEPLLHTTPSRLPPATAQACFAMATQAIHALGLQCCAVQTRLRQGPGGVGVVDVAALPAGDGLATLVQLARGVDPVRAAGEAALGVRPLLPVGSAQAATLGFFVPTSAQIQRGDVLGRPLLEGLVDFAFWPGWGDEAAAGVRLGYAVGVGRTAAESRAVVEHARRWTATRSGLELAPLA